MSVSLKRTDRSEVIKRNNEISRLSSRKDLRGCQRLYDKAVRELGGANTHTYCAMINAYILCGDMDGAVKVFADLKSRKFEPDVVSYTTMIKGYCQLANNIESAVQLFEEMILISSRKGTKILPNIRTVNTILRGCVHNGKVSVAEKIFKDLKVIEVIPDTSSWEYMILLHSQHLNLEKLLPMAGRIPTTLSVLSLASIHANIARVASILGEWRVCRKFIKSAEAYVASCDDNVVKQESTSEDDGEDIDDVPNALGGKRRWKTKESDENREQSLQNYRLHQLDESKLDISETKACLQRNESQAQQLILLKQLPIIIRSIYLSDLKCKSLSGILTSLEMFTYRYLEKIHEVVDSEVMEERSSMKSKKSRQISACEETPFPSGSKAFNLRRKIGDLRTQIMTETSRVNLPLLLSKSESIHDDVEVDNSVNTRSGRLMKLEICSGTGEWVISQALADPSADWISLELRHDRVFRTLTRALQQNVSNLSVLQGDAKEVLPSCFEDDLFDNVFINHPEPPQQSSAGLETQAQHLLSIAFFSEISRVLKFDGLLTILTDNLWYARFLLREISSSSFPSNLSSVELQPEQIPAKSCQDWSVFETQRGVHLYKGKPGILGGHVVDSSSYFDR